MDQPAPESYEAHHADNQRRFMAIETKLDANTDMTKKLAGDTAKLAGDTAELVEMWKDAGVFFKWMRRFGVFTLWISKIVLVVAAVYTGIRYGWKDGK